MVYYLYFKHASSQRPEKTGYRDIDLMRLSDFARGYVRGFNDATKEWRYSAVICDDQAMPVIKITKEGTVGHVHVTCCGKKL